MKPVVTLQSLIHDQLDTAEQIGLQKSELIVLEKHWLTLDKLIRQQCNHEWKRTSIDNGPFAKQYECDICKSINYIH